MTTAEVIEQTVARGHLAESRRLAIDLYAECEELLEHGDDPRALLDVLYTHHHKYKSAGDTVPRDAIAEVIEGIEDRLNVA